MVRALLIVYFFYIIGLSAQKQFNCALPDLGYPKNGFYHTVEIDGVQINNAIIKFGYKVSSYTLKLKCDTEYAGVGSDTLVCRGDGTLQYTDFECLPICKQSGPLLSCGSDSRCVVHSEHRQLDNTTDAAVTAPSSTLSLAGYHQHEEGCGLKDNSAAHVAGGYSAKLGDLPWHAGIYSKKTSPYMQICGGTLISHNVVISAAHCFWKNDKLQPPSIFAVGVGKVYRPWNEPRDQNAQKSDVAEIRVPPHFKGHETNLQDDIAILIVSSPFTLGNAVRAACLDFNEETDRKYLEPGKTTGIVAGWGLTSENSLASQVLKMADLPVVDLQECYQQADHGFRAHITSDKFCAGVANGTAVCKGDSGGGFFMGIGVARVVRYYLRGVVSGAPQSEHLCNIYTWATFTPVLKHERFIKDTLEEFKKRTPTE